MNPRFFVTALVNVYDAQNNRPADQLVDPIAQAAMLALCESVPGRS